LENFQLDCFFPWKACRSGLELTVSRFFSLVRLKIACKDASKIPHKRLYEMKQKMYVVQFTVEKSVDNGNAEEGGDTGDDNND
jgi:hypothetical protein